MESLSPLYEALLNAQKDIGEPFKDGHNKFSNYDYTTAENMIRCCKAALHSNGLVLIPVSTVFREEGKSESEDYGPETKTIIKREYDLAHFASGAVIRLEHEYAVCRTPSKDPGKYSMDWDKSGAASQTSGQAYFLRDLLQAPRAEDEVDSGSRENHTAKLPANEDTYGQTGVSSEPVGNVHPAPPSEKQLTLLIKMINEKDNAKADQTFITAINSMPDDIESGLLFLFDEKMTPERITDLVNTSISHFDKKVVSEMIDLYKVNGTWNKDIAKRVYAVAGEDLPFVPLDFKPPF